MDVQRRKSVSIQEEVEGLLSSCVSSSRAASNLKPRSSTDVNRKAVGELPEVRFTTH